MIAAVVLAAGESRRMGRPKMVMPWGDTTVICQVVSTLIEGGVEDVVVVTGGAREEVEAALEGFPVQMVFNPDYANGEMIQSLRVGIGVLNSEAEATLIVLGDHPQIQGSVVAALLQAYKKKKSLLVVPSYKDRRGHPWLVDRTLIPALLSLKAPLTLRDFMNRHAEKISYLSLETSSILQDLDTPEDYQRFKPG